MTLVEVERTQHAALASRNLQRRPLVAVRAMKNFFSNYDIEGIPVNQIQAVAGAINEAWARALQGDGVAGTTIGATAEQYAPVYVQRRNHTEISALRTAVEYSGFNNFHAGFQEYVNANSDRTYTQVQAAANAGNQDARRALGALQIYEEQKFTELGLTLEREIERELTVARVNAVY
jgi:hypothetical protein